MNIIIRSGYLFHIFSIFTKFNLPGFGDTEYIQLHISRGSHLVYSNAMDSHYTLLHYTTDLFVPQLALWTSVSIFLTNLVCIIPCICYPWYDFNGSHKLRYKGSTQHFKSPFYSLCLFLSFVFTLIIRVPLYACFMHQVIVVTIFDIENMCILLSRAWCGITLIKLFFHTSV